MPDRADLLIAPTGGDHCDVFQPGEPGDGDCQTDGHYLCASCSQAAPSERHRLGTCPLNVLLCPGCYDDEQEKTRSEAESLGAQAALLEYEARVLRGRERLLRSYLDA